MAGSGSDRRPLADCRAHHHRCAAWQAIRESVLGDMVDRAMIRGLIGDVFMLILSIICAWILIDIVLKATSP
jgi:hypothetical protein